MGVVFDQPGQSPRGCTHPFQKGTQYKQAMGQFCPSVHPEVPSSKLLDGLGNLQNNLILLHICSI